MTAKAKPSRPWDIIEAEFVYGCQEPPMPPPLGVEIAFAGRSNVGKSSLMNALMGRRNLVRTSSTPGCTRQINFFRAQARDGAVMTLVDLPGYGYAKRSKTERAAWARLIEGYLSEREHLRAVAVLVDARRGLEEEELQLIDFVNLRPENLRPRTVVAATKIDKLQKSKRKAELSKLKAAAGHPVFGGRVFGVSASEGEGLEPLWRTLRRAADIAVAEKRDEAADQVSG